jgi:hypothetical protein
LTGPLRIGLVPIARPTFDTALAVEATAQARQLLRGKGWQLSGPEDTHVGLETFASFWDQTDYE